jgi:hypothetical protein
VAQQRACRPTPVLCRTNVTCAAWHLQVFLTDNYLVLVMEYAGGGDLFKHVSRNKGLSEDDARWFFQQIMFAIEYCHKMVRPGAAVTVGCNQGLLPHVVEPRCCRCAEAIGGYCKIMIKVVRCKAPVGVVHWLVATCRRSICDSEAAIRCRGRWTGCRGLQVFVRWVRKLACFSPENGRGVHCRKQ